MTYYPTLLEDIARAKEILAKGRCAVDDLEVVHGRDNKLREHIIHVMGGTIYGADIYAAYKLLESFVGELERRTKLTQLFDALDPEDQDFVADLIWQQLQSRES